jgi:hypothetical protein
MYRARNILLATAAIVVMAACADTPTAVIPAYDSGGALDLTLPMLEAAMLVAVDASEERPAGAVVQDPEAPPAPDPSTVPTNIMSQITNARTNAGFSVGYGHATGQHWYQGNKSRIDTSVSVSFEGTPLGSQAASKEADAWYWFDFGSWKHIFANARFYTDRVCGLTAYGSSSHSAWWEATIPPAVARYGQVGLTTISDLVRQAECPPPEPEYTTSSGASGGGGSMLCYIWIEYDLYTGEVYSVELLYCEDVGG